MANSYGLTSAASFSGVFQGMLMQQNPSDDRGSSDRVLFEGWSLALDSLSLPPVAAQELPRLFTLSRLVLDLQGEMQTLGQIAQELSAESNKREVGALISAAQSVIPKASALYNAISQLSGSQNRTVLQETGQIVLGCFESIRSSAALLINLIDSEEGVDEDPLPDHSTLVVNSSLHSSGDITTERKQQNVNTALGLMTLLFEEVREETENTRQDALDPKDSRITFSPATSLAVSQLYLLLQQDPELPHRIMKEFVTTAFQSPVDQEDAAERLSIILSLFERFKDASLQLGGVLRTASALAAQADDMTNSYLSILRGESTSSPKNPSRSSALSIIRDNVETCSGGLQRLSRLLDYSIAGDR